MGRGEGGGGRGSCDHLLLLSEDVLIQILLWLPVLSLLRFKSVCKSWRAIIQSPFFINLHLATTEDSGSNSNSFIFLEYQEYKGKICTLSGDEFEVFEDLGRPPLLDLGEKIEWIKEWEEFLVVGCLNGIICLHDFLTRNVALWNPVIKQSRVLPKPSNPLGNPIFYSIGLEPAKALDFVRFGIDIKTNDYKLLLITTYKPHERYEGYCEPHQHRIHVYSLSTDSWKCLDNATLSAAHPDPDVRINEDNNQGLYLNGSYFFTAYVTYGMPLLLSFDFTEEIFTIIQSPFDESAESYFISFGKKVALIDAKLPLGEHKYYDIWVLNEQHGVKESWTKFYTIESPDNIIPQAITNNGEFAIIYGWYSQNDCVRVDGKFELLNLITGEKKNLRFGFKGLWQVIFFHKPSLVPIAGI